VSPSLSKSGRFPIFSFGRLFRGQSALVDHIGGSLNCFFTFVHRYSIIIMVFSVAKAAALAALLCPLVTPLGVPSSLSSSDFLRPRVPWKDTGLWDHNKRDGYPTGDACNHGPSSRGCWHGDFDIDTDMDEHWPDTGKTVKVCRLDTVRSINVLMTVVSLGYHK
jgi:hypothetical protein